MSQDPDYQHPWTHLFPISPTLSPLTKESIQQLISLSKGPLPVPISLPGYITQLISCLLNTETYYSEELCKNLQPSSPLWIAMLISNTIKQHNPNLHSNKHLHPIHPLSLLDYLQPPLIAYLAQIYK
jgi:hypothetical protein